MGWWKDARAKVRQWFNLRFFWQLILAFTLVIVLVSGGMALAGNAAMRRLERHRTPRGSAVWESRLARYYEDHGSWEGIEEFIATYPCGSGWGPWDETWRVPFVLAGPDGVVVAASDPHPDRLTPFEQRAAAPIQVDGQPVGWLLLFPLISPREPSRAVGAVLPGFLLTAVAIGAGSLVVGLVLSRGMSRPLTRLTEAARAVAAGNLSVRVPTDYPGEIGELAAAFNGMIEELARADQLRRNLTADVAHELRTPLSVVRAKLEGILDGVYEPTPEQVEPILEEIHVLTRLVDDLRLLALAEAGQLPLEKEPLDLADLLSDIRVNFEPQAADRGITLALDLPTALPRVRADRRRISQVLSNLVSNALRHTPAGGCVTLAAGVKEDAVEVSVSDTGVGIPPEDLPFVFERFWRRERSRSRGSGGSGLGLTIAKQLVEMHGGTIGVESVPGAGSRFWFRLPLRGAASPPPATATRPR